MTAFDSKLWRKRAWGRFTRAVRAGSPKAETEPTWALDVCAIGDLELLVGWCESKKLKVGFVKKVGATYYPNSKEVLVSSRLSPRRQVAFLIHECGHHLIGMKEHSERYGMGYPQTDPEVTKTFHHREACLEEEMEAWHRGWKLAQRLGLSLDREFFDEVRLECLRSYIKWTLRPGPKDKEKE